MQTQETAVQGESRAGAQPHEGSGQEGGGRAEALHAREGFLQAVLPEVLRPQTRLQHPSQPRDDQQQPRPRLQEARP